MKRRGLSLKRLWIHAAALGIVAFLTAPAADAQLSSYNSVITLLGGVGGSLDESDSGLGNPTFQLGYSGVIDDNTLVSLRAGQMSFGSDKFVGAWFDSSLRYVTIAGEYRSRQGFYSGALVESGVYIGLGAYNLRGTALEEIEKPEVTVGLLEGEAPEPVEPEFESVDSSETSIGFALGLVGDWEISRRWVFRFELSGHYALLDQAKLFAMAHAGFGIRF